MYIIHIKSETLEPVCLFGLYHISDHKNTFVIAWLRIRVDPGYMKRFTPNPDFNRITRSQQQQGNMASTTTSTTTSTMTTTSSTTTGNSTATTSSGIEPTSAAGSSGRPELQFLKFDTSICEKFDPGCTDAHTWLHKFLAIATYANWNNNQMCFYFGLHLLKDAYTWFSNLPNEISQNFDALKDQFTARFGLNGATKWSVLPEIYDMKQRQDQTAQDFIQKVQMKAKLINLPEEQVIGALMKGFLPHIRADLIRSEIKSIADVTKEAAISEQAHKIKGPQSDSILSEERLVKAIQTAMSVSNLQPAIRQSQPFSELKQPPRNKSQQRFNYNNRTQQKPTYNKPSGRPAGLRVNPNYICIRCDRQGHHYQNECPFIDVVCYGCSKVGHIQRACKSKSQQ